MARWSNVISACWCCAAPSKDFFKRRAMPEKMHRTLRRSRSSCVSSAKAQTPLALVVHWDSAGARSAGKKSRCSWTLDPKGANDPNGCDPGSLPIIPSPTISNCIQLPSSPPLHHDKWHQWQEQKWNLKSPQRPRYFWSSLGSGQWPAVLSCIFLLQLGSYKSTTKNGVLHYPIKRTKGMSCKRQIILACTIHVYTTFRTWNRKYLTFHLPILAWQAKPKKK